MPAPSKGPARPPHPDLILHAAPRAGIARRAGSRDAAARRTKRIEVAAVSPRDGTVKERLATPQVAMGVALVSLTLWSGITLLISWLF